ncbi:hypothetical protein L5515_016187 [Caenorhabditis briggsae]|uniref:Uncharacterized protein n=2 Tax=Caenorhabditis briggsae TaxID=6238 RepID=A0AAE9FBI1_CAEBR|nr:hypothetical protein L3Y34_010300 [Caenorhabditis briggsae]UMM38922.1 hypothetical protein L5515_016187 [Caenorhabditis briggsae]
MSNLISEPLDVMTNKEMHQLYEHKGIDPKNNMLDVTQKDMELCHKHWPDNFETLYDIGAKAFETFLVDRHHLVKLFKVDQVKSETWRQHFVLDRCVLHMLQMLHETISVYHEDMSGGNKIDEEFFKKIQTFGGRYRCLAPMVPVKEYFHLFNVWTEMHMDFIVLTCFEGPVCNKEKAIISGVWEKIIQNIKVHFVYGWHHKLYNMTREEKEYFMKEKTSEPTRSRLITKLTRLMSRESFSDTSSEDKTSPTRKTSQNQPSLSGLGSSRSRDTPSGRSNHLTIATSSREADIIRSEPIEICDISLNLLNSPADCSPINISNHF